MYTKGGRGGEVYIVDTLEDSGPGSLRDAVSQSKRIIVFRTSGVIQLQSNLKMARDISIYGQTSPGSGITVTGYPVTIGSNTIIQHMRFRLGDANQVEGDAFGARKQRDIIIDHSSFSWSTDEVASLYENENVTVSWSIFSEALHVSEHVKGKHGYGGIWGGKNVTFHHNLLAHNSSRNPAFESKKDNTIEYYNNVIYNWGFFSAYGGKEADVNMINNYYKAGPDTENVRFLNAETAGRYYLAGNVMEGFPEFTKDNWSGVHKSPDHIQLEQPFSLSSQPVANIEAADQAYEAVLAHAGARLPQQDAIDARIIHDVQNGTGRQINSQKEVGGYPQYEAVQDTRLDSDNDGMPDKWEEANKLNPKDASDASADQDGDGYTNIEEYIHSLTKPAAGNPTIKLTGPAYNGTYEHGRGLTIQAEAADQNGKIDKVLFYAGDQLIGEDAAAPFEFVWEKAAPGTHFISAIAVNDSGAAAAASAVPVHLYGLDDALSPWLTAEIGKPGIPGNTVRTEDQFTIMGAGRIDGKSDSLHFAYQPIRGDFEFTARIARVSGNDASSKGGILLRTGLMPDSPTFMIAASYEKMGMKVRALSRLKSGDDFTAIDTADVIQLPIWVKLTREGETVTARISKDGTAWTELDTKSMTLGAEVYIGMAGDPNNSEKRDVKNMNTTILSDVSIKK